MQRVNQYKKRFEQLKAQRSNFESHWTEISEVVRPRAGSFTSLVNTKGQKQKPSLYDSTGVHANELLAAGFFGNLTSPTTKWFSLEIEDVNLNASREVQLWMEQVSNIMFTEMQRPQTGFVTAFQECYLDYGAYGNCVMFITEHNNHLSFIALPLQECFFIENDYGKVSSLYRNYMRTVAQLVERYGLDAVHKDVKKMYLEDQLDEEIPCLHVMEPEDGRYSSIYIDCKHDHILQESFFVEAPFMAARFQKTSYEVYGSGPGSTALADLKSLQEIAATTLRGAQKIVDPPLIVADNAFITPIRTYPGAMNYQRSVGLGEPLRPLVTGAQPQLGEDLSEGIRNRVREIFYVNQLQLNRGPEMTATEVMARTEQNMRTMGPIMGRAMTELLSPCIHRVFGILWRAGKLPPYPDVLANSGTEMRIIYNAPMVKVQEQSQADNLMKVFQILMPLASADPSALEVYNIEAIARDLNSMHSLSPRYIRSEEELAQMREARAQQQQEAMAQQSMKDMGIGFNNLASGVKTLSQM